MIKEIFEIEQLKGKRKCDRCGKPFKKKGKYERLCKSCFNTKNKRNRRKNSIAKTKRRIFYLIRKSEFIHPICRGKVIEEIKKGLGGKGKDLEWQKFRSKNG